MSRVYHSANPDHIFTSRAEIEEHLLAKISKNAGGKTGTELELFVTGREGRPITFDQVELVLEHMASQFKGASFQTEKGRVVGVNIPDVGDVCLEPGGQVELSTKPCRDLQELEDMNRVMCAALEKTAAFLDLKVEGRGHMPSFLVAEDMPRSRFAAYCEYLRDLHGKPADDLINTMKSCCGLQVNVDPMGQEFHEIYRALMLVDVTNAISQRTERQERLHETYAKLVPAQMTPLFEALTANDNEQVVGHMVDRLLTLRVPFMPDPTSPEGFKSTASVFGFTPTVGGLLKGGALTTEILDNALSLQLMMPNLRRHGVLETRAPDSPSTTEDVMQIAAQYHRFAYDAEARQALLKDFAGVDPQLLKQAFLDRFDDPNILSRDIGGDKKMSDLAFATGTLEQPVASPAMKPTSKPGSGI